MNLPLPDDIGDWNWETVLTLSTVVEGQYLEYKAELHRSVDTEGFDSEWKKKLEREVTAFANASGGIIVFGVDDDGEPNPIERPEHELKQSITRLIQNTQPPVDIDIAEPIEVPDPETDRVILPVYINEATRKPVLTSDSAIYFRINDRKEPMSIDQLEKLIIERDRRQQAIRQLEMEIDRFSDLLEEEGRRRLSENADEPPDFHLIDTDSLKSALQRNTHLYSGEDTREAIIKVFRHLREVEDEEAFYNGVIRGDRERRAGAEEFNKKRRKEFNLDIEQLERSLERLAEVADLQVNVRNDESSK
ncbi:hypothetical protein DJ83_14490 [Halorubrum ezzemoulense]|uniref:Schlafen AlbA-2 domain-containing protein n=1 Tax=Halorubrum ezzemoulense TaxID=337243 RepID=A0A256IR29_HALEZ|nr:ATP-binding protein [Halorubrum ezzemoulense]OYR58756.1 hypothetical protein DJ83_14490 [Halorubrum ezzemoulense]